jgi:hypothetical protein
MRMLVQGATWERYTKGLLGEIYVPNRFLHEQTDQQIPGQETMPAIEPVVESMVSSSLEEVSTLLELDQYVDFDAESSGLFGDREIEAAKQFIKKGYF